MSLVDSGDAIWELSADQTEMRERKEKSHVREIERGLLIL